MCTAPRPWSRKRPKEDKAKEDGLREEMEMKLLSKLTDEPDDDDVLLFLRSLAPRIRDVSKENQFNLRMEIMQVIHKYGSQNVPMPYFRSHTPNSSTSTSTTPPSMLSQIPSNHQAYQQEWHPQYTMLG